MTTAIHARFLTRATNRFIFSLSCTNRMTRQEAKNIAVLVMWSAAFAVSLPLLYQQIGGASPVFAFIVTLTPMGLLRYVHPVRSFGTPYCFHRLRDCEHHPEFAKKLGLPAFAWLLRHSPLRLLNSFVYLRRWPGAPARVLKHVLEAEASHFWAFFAAIPYIAFALFHGWWAGLTVGCTVQIVGNIYPYLHLRKTRSRLSTFIARSSVRLELPSKAPESTPPSVTPPAGAANAPSPCLADR